MSSPTLAVLSSTLSGAIRSGTPLLFAALGELIYERSGVLNLSIEGLMLAGALAAVATQVASGSWIVSLLAALGMGALLGTLHGFVCTVLRANQVAAGLALMTLLQGLTALLGRNFVGTRIVADLPAGIPGLENVSFVGPVLFQHDVLVYLAAACVPATWFFLYRTRPGVALRAAGEDARTAAARGLTVVRIRLLAGTAAGAFAALGGAYLSLAYASQWQEGMVAGRGWIALVLVICSFWRPRILVFSAYLFGGLSALQLNLQATGLSWSSYVLGMLPFVASLIMLVFASSWLRRRPLGAPADLARPYQPL